MPYVGQDFPPADLAEVKPLSFDLNGSLVDGETISSVAFTMTLVSGTDQTPNHITGSNTVTGTIVSNTFSWIGSTQVGNRYCISSVSTTSLSNKYSWWSYISISQPA